jgi:hypothetical protein
MLACTGKRDFNPERDRRQLLIATENTMPWNEGAGV